MRDFFYGLLDDAKAAHVVASKWYEQELGIDVEQGFEAMCRIWDDAYNDAANRCDDGVYGANSGDLGDDDDDIYVEVPPQFTVEERDRIITAIGQFLSEFKPALAIATLVKLQAAMRDLKNGETIHYESAIYERDGTFALTRKPGAKLPTSHATLDLLEELIHHLIRSGDSAGALALYTHRMGGRDHLAKALGDYERGMRIMLMFKPCPRMLDLAWYLRGVGDLTRSYEIMKQEKPIWSGTILCLRGLLADARGPRYWHSTQHVAALLMGELNDLPHGPAFGWGEVLVDADYHLLRGQYALAAKVAHAQLEANRIMRGYMPETIRCRLVIAESHRLRGEMDQAVDHLERARPWITRSGSVEHLCLLHLVHARLLVARCQFADARAIASEAVQLARRCGFSLYHIDLMNVLASIELLQRRDAGIKSKSSDFNVATDYLAASLLGVRAADDRPAASNDEPLEQLMVLGSRHSQCRYVHGECESLRIRAEILHETGERKEAVAQLAEAIQLQKRHQIPGLQGTKKRLKEMRGKWRFW